MDRAGEYFGILGMERGSGQWRLERLDHKQNIVKGYHWALRVL